MTNQTVASCFQEVVENHFNKKAITFYRNGKPETDITFGELERDVRHMAYFFNEHKVHKGERVILYTEKSLITVVAHLALQKMGAVSVPINPGFRKSEMSYLLNDADASLILAGQEQADVVRTIAPAGHVIEIDTRKPYQDIDFFRVNQDYESIKEILSDDPALIIYTSGTTGKPKGAVLTQANLVHDLKNIGRIWEITEKDVLCHALPLFHLHGLCFALHACLMSGSGVLMVDAFNPETVLELLSRQGGEDTCTIFMAVPAMYNKMIDALREKKADFSHIRLWTSGSAPLLVKDFKKIMRIFGKEPVEREGMSETGMNFSNPVKEKRKPGSIGLPLPDLAVRIVDPESFKDMGPNKTGEIWLKGPSIIHGYWRKPDETKASFVNGWFRTGDLGRVDDEGYYYITDRIKNIIISGGENISPKEIEEVINNIDGVIESSVVGIENEKWGEIVVAAVVRKTGSNLKNSDIQTFCREHLHKWKCPKEIKIVDELPKNTMGKVLTEKVKRFFK